MRPGEVLEALEAMLDSMGFTVEYYNTGEIQYFWAFHRDQDLYLESQIPFCSIELRAHLPTGSFYEQVPVLDPQGTLQKVADIVENFYHKLVEARPAGKGSPCKET